MGIIKETMEARVLFRAECRREADRLFAQLMLALDSTVPEVQQQMVMTMLLNEIQAASRLNTAATRPPPTSVPGPGRVK
jgi:hypothetical protein